jgi:hypothetical protein
MRGASANTSRNRRKRMRAWIRCKFSMMNDPL